MANLKPCPFCGGEAHLSADTSHSTAFFISCETEDCFGLMQWAETQAEAIAAWNTRATPDPLSDLRAKLAVAVEALSEISKQKKTTEISTEYEVEFADFEDGYDTCIDEARAALAQIKGDE